MQTVLIATDADSVAADVAAAVAGAGITILRVRRGRDVRDAVAEHNVDVAVIDLQIGSMGGVATTIQLRQEAEAGRLRDVDVVLLVDREADRFLAAQAEPDAVVVKPFSMAQMLDAMRSLHPANH